MIRATTIGVLKNYRYGLNNSFSKLNSARATLLTHRNFNSFAEDPSAAALSFQLRRSRMTVESQKTVCDTAYRKFQSAWSSLETVINKVDNVTKNSISEADLKALNEPTSGDYGGRSALGKELDELANTLVQVMNNKYADSFLFSGADGQTVPFTWGDKGELLYRGIPVDASVPDTLTAGTDANGDPQKISVTLDANGNYDPAGTTSYLLAGKSELVEYVPGGTAPENALTDAAGNPVILKEDGTAYATMDEVTTDIAAGKKPSYVTVKEGGTISEEDYNTEVENAEKLSYLSEEEKLFLDIGQGNKEDENNKVIESSVFDSTLQGINFLGFGKDEDGDPKNIVTITKQMAKICNQSGEGRLTDEEYNELFRLSKKFENSAEELRRAHVEMDARSSKLENNLDLLNDNYDTLVQQYAEIEDVDDADAISAFIWAQYSYNAALRVGNSVLAQSLMDYMQ